MKTQNAKTQFITKQEAKVLINSSTKIVSLVFRKNDKITKMNVMAKAKLLAGAKTSSSMVLNVYNMTGHYEKIDLNNLIEMKFKGTVLNIKGQTPLKTENVKHLNKMFA